MSSNAIAAMAVILVAGFAGCAATSRTANAQAAPEIASTQIAAFPTWTEQEPSYRFFPGDAIDVTFPMAPELNRRAIVAPDGRIGLPLVGAIMAADKTSDELASSLTSAYSAHLRVPQVEVSAATAAAGQVFVGGEVERPGLYDIGAGADAMQAVIQAGGFKASAKRDGVLILRRAAGGGSSVYNANLSKRAFQNGLAQLGPLERFDVVYVPSSRVSDVGSFVQRYVRDALPVNLGLYYDLAQR